eukprot:scaffold95100_cov19-Prasinocladus_malaysianus.AAC.2
MAFSALSPYAVSSVLMSFCTRQSVAVSDLFTSPDLCPLLVSGYRYSGTVRVQARKGLGSQDAVVTSTVVAISHILQVMSSCYEYEY